MVSFVNTSLANPEYINTQEHIIKNLSAGEVADILPNRLFEHCSTYQHTGNYSVALTNNERLLIFNKRNGVSVLVVTKREVSLGYRNIERITEHYFVDRHTGKAFNAFQVLNAKLPLRDNPKIKEINQIKNERQLGEPYILLTQKKGAAQYFADGFGGLFYLDLPDLTEGESISDIDAQDFFTNFSLLHESGHRLQHHLLADQSDMDLRLLLLDLVLRLTTSVSPRLVRTLQTIPLIKKYLEVQRSQRVELERNAHAFSLGVIRKLKTLGVDLGRGIEKNQMILLINRALLSYDRHYSGVFGPQFSKIRNKFLGKK